MPHRREFTPKQKECIVERSKRSGVIHCEGCGLALGGKPHEIDHIIAEAIRPAADKLRPLTIADGQLLGKECCHRGKNGKTSKDVKLAAKARRQYAKANGVIRPAGKIKSAGFARSAKAASRQPKAQLPFRALYEAKEERT
jgi:hypothetical protein